MPRPTLPLVRHRTVKQIRAKYRGCRHPIEKVRWHAIWLLSRTEEPRTPAQVAELQKLVDDGKLNDKLARSVLEGVVAGEGDPAAVMASRGLGLVSDTGAIAAAVDEAIAAHPEIAAKVRDGKVAAAGALVGAVMKTTRGQADAKTVRDLILARLT